MSYDHDLTRKAGKPGPAAVWADLQAIGYSYVGIWDNFGKMIQVLPIDEVPARAAVLDKSVADRGYDYWDVAVVHAYHDAGKAVVGWLFG